MGKNAGCAKLTVPTVPTTDPHYTDGVPTLTRLINVKSSTHSFFPADEHLVNTVIETFNLSVSLGLLSLNS